MPPPAVWSSASVRTAPNTRASASASPRPTRSAVCSSTRTARSWAPRWSGPSATEASSSSPRRPGLSRRERPRAPRTRLHRPGPPWRPGTGIPLDKDDPHMMNAAQHLLSQGVVASIPSPPISYFDIGPLRIHIYALCIIAGIIVATLMTNSRLTKRGAEPWVVIDIALIAVPLAIIAARVYHVLSHFDFYFGEGRNPLSALYIWEGGIAIYGALIGGAIGAWLGCRWTGIRFTTFADALAPGLLLAQALGRFGNWFNQELFGLPTDVPWGLEINSDNPAFPPGLEPGTLFHPTFLYEVIWNTLGVLFLLWVGRRFRLQWARLFALYLIWYSSGRI